MNNPEVFKGSAERGVEVGNEAAERSKELAEQLETRGEKGVESNSERAEKARNDAEAIISKEAGKERAGAEPTSAPSSIYRITKAEKQASYTKTMEQVRAEMSAPARAFSKAIHAPFVEKSSEVLGSSLARPNAILAGSFAALLFVTAIYTVARVYGYRLSGFETIGAFVIGWISGILFDYVKVMVTGKR